MRRGLLPVSNLLKIQAFRITRIAGILDAGEDVFDIFSFSGTEADIQKDTDDEAGHIMQKIICMDENLHLLSVAVDLDVVDFPLCIFAFSGR